MKRIFTAVLLVAVAAPLLAHGNMEHVLGTVTEITPNSISVQTPEGAVEVVAINEATHFVKGDSPASLKDIQVGSRVVIHAHWHEGKLEAAEIKIGIATPPRKP